MFSTFIFSVFFLLTPKKMDQNELNSVIKTLRLINGESEENDKIKRVARKRCSIVLVEYIVLVFLPTWNVFLSRMQGAVEPNSFWIFQDDEQWCFIATFKHFNLEFLFPDDDDDDDSLSLCLFTKTTTTIMKTVILPVNRLQWFKSVCFSMFSR